jgi:hypothetical protein
MATTDVTVFKIKQDSLYPPYITQLVGPDKNPLNLTNCTVVFHMQRRYGDYAPVVSAASVIAGNEALPAGSDLPNVQHDWISGETAVAGDYDVDIEVVFPDTKPLFAPTEGFDQVKIYPRLK